MAHFQGGDVDKGLAELETPAKDGTQDSPTARKG